VAVIDDNPTVGGQIWRGGKVPTGDKRAVSLLRAFDESPVECRHGTRVVAAPERGTLLTECDGEAIEFGYKKLILATGARERFLPFPGWTLPNVVGAGGLQALLKAGLDVAGKRIVIAGSGPLLLSVAAYARQHGAVVPLVAEQAPWRRVASFGLQLLWLDRGKLRQGAGYRWTLRNTRYLAGCWATSAHGCAKVEAVSLRCGGRNWTEPCDIFACGFGLVPNLELPALLGCEVRDGFVVVDELQQSSVPGVYCAGEITGIGGAELAIMEGIIAGHAATGTTVESHHYVASNRRRAHRFVAAMEHAFRLRLELRELPDDDTFICRCEDVTLKRLRSFSSWREAKLHTRCGMGPCQGRICGAASEFLFGWKHDSVRPPILPTSVGTLAVCSGRAKHE
jgi:NADPH-dependent 2,4-dienoyl-CoA reductase/sulfur reductase-like enzyme